MNNKIAGHISITLALLQLLLIITSWVITAAVPDLPVRSLLGSEGIRWFFGRFMENMQSPLVIWLLLLVIGLGAFQRSGLAIAIHKVAKGRSLLYRERTGLRFAVVELVIFVVIMLLLTVMPHAILLSITGELFPSSFAHSIIPVLAFVLVICSLSYGVVSGKLRSVGEAYSTMISGFAHVAWIFPIYILAAELYYSFLFVFALG